jgi:hypothetical protein
LRYCSVFTANVFQLSAMGTWLTDILTKASTDIRGLQVRPETGNRTGLSDLKDLLSASSAAFAANIEPDRRYRTLFVANAQAQAGSFVVQLGLAPGDLIVLL